MRAGAIPLADIERLSGAARRTREVRLLAGLGCTVIAGLSLVVALRMHPTTTAFVPEGTNGVVVLDVSASISDETYAGIAATLEQLARTHGRYGLILFSDTAYQALPPATPAKELRAFERFFVVPRQTAPGSIALPPSSPWSSQFSAGTRISTGLRLALDVVRAKQVHRPAVVLVSDLDDDAGDIEALTSVALAYRKLGIPLRVVGLNPSPEDERLVKRLLAQPNDLRAASPPAEGGSRVDGASPALLIVLALGAAASLALLLVLFERLRWSEA
jgi:NAD(P)-dependent dehydrogenase (short-subunit alcohol dehydrogenase family)